MGEAEATRRVTVMITSPLEPEYAARIAAAHPDQVELIYRPDLLPPTRFIADHQGPPDWHRTPQQVAEWHALLRRAEVLWDFPARETLGTLELSPRLRWVQTTSAGIGQYVKRLGLQASDLLVTTASGVHARPLAEFALGALLFHTKRFGHLLAEQRAHRWDRYCTVELHGRTMAVIGTGRIGREVVRLAGAFGMTVWGLARTYDPRRTDAIGVDRLFPRVELRAMLAGADCVVLCLPHTPDTENLIGADEIAALKPGVVLVNIARGVVIDEEALITALRSGQIGFAALDVFREEPLPPDSPLWDLPNVLVNPHSASTADTENAKITDIFLQNLDHYLTGQLDRMSPVLDKQRLY